MLRSILAALGAAACLFAFAALGEVAAGAVTRAMAGVAMGIAMSALLYGEATFAAVALGAVSPLLFAATERASLAVAASAMCLLWLAPRFVLADTRRKLVLLTAVSLVAAFVAGFIFAAYREAPLAAHAASCVFAGSCLSLVGVVVPVATTTAYALRTAAAVIDGPVRDVLLRAAEVHESSRWQPRGRAARRKWRTIVRLSDQRAALEGASGRDAEEQRRDIDQRIEAAARELAPAPGEPTVAPIAATPTSDAASPDSTVADSPVMQEQALNETESSGEPGAPIEERPPAAAEARTMPPTDV
ncbi:MAG TPA: hypothetical protein VK540_20455 [Polyangiaceae bacterium]|nr:hypothetical protein [Polyangiaceae bacterium]